jgi:hypothetical protein
LPHCFGCPCTVSRTSTSEVTKLLYSIFSGAVNSFGNRPLPCLVELKSADENIANRLVTEIWQIHANKIFRSRCPSKYQNRRWPIRVLLPHPFRIARAPLTRPSLSHFVFAFAVLPPTARRLRWLFASCPLFPRQASLQSTTKSLYCSCQPFVRCRCIYCSSGNRAE